MVGSKQQAFHPQAQALREAYKRGADRFAQMTPTEQWRETQRDLDSRPGAAAAYDKLKQMGQ